MKDNMQLNWN